jgi:hypothetical protein
MTSPLVIMAWTVNISELSVTYRRNISVDNVNGKNRQNNIVGECGMGSNFFAILGKILMALFRL